MSQIDTRIRATDFVRDDSARGDAARNDSARRDASRPLSASPVVRAARWGATLSLLFVVACGGSEGDMEPSAGSEGAAGASAAETAEGDLSRVGLENLAQPRPGLVTSGQPTQAQVNQLRRLGYENFISLRPVVEPGAGWEEEALAEGSFERIAIAGPEDLTRENVEALDRALAEAGDANTVLYCASSNRVGALMALRALWVEGVEPDSALALGRAAGLTSLEPAVQELLAAGR
ncbi:MAG TPA: sulfur transferase domain-containing protein [Longimicrobiales bacterium]|nr:sulfur transferase domain-containing protein [Longimicrobiales bacterium]